MNSSRKPRNLKPSRLVLARSGKKTFFPAEFDHSDLIFFETLTFLEAIFREKLENRVHFGHKWLQTDLSGICRQGHDCTGNILGIYQKINENLIRKHVVSCYKMITIARNRLRMNVLTHMMCYEHPTVHFSGALLTKIRFWSKK